MFPIRHIPLDYQGDFSFKSHRCLTFQKVKVSVFKTSLVFLGIYFVVSVLDSFDYQNIKGIFFLISSFIWVFILIFVMSIFHRLSNIDRYLSKKNPHARFFPDHHISSQEFMESGLFQTTDLNVKGESLIIDKGLKICQLSAQQLKLKQGITQSIFDGIFIIKRLNKSHDCQLLIKQKDEIKDSKFPAFLKRLSAQDHEIESDKILMGNNIFNSNFNVYCNQAKRADEILTVNRMQLILDINEQMDALLSVVQRSKNNSPFKLVCSFKNDYFYMAIRNLQMRTPLFYFKRRKHFNTISNIIEMISKI